MKSSKQKNVKLISKCTIVILSVVLLLVPFTSCSGTFGSESGSAENLGLNDYGLDEQYIPIAPETKYSSTVDVHLVFGDTLPGWNNVVKEYNKLQPRVRVNLVTATAQEYGQLVNQEIQSGQSEWDIFHGNYIGATIDRYAYDMYSDISKKNNYAGNQIWKTVLGENAYISDTTGRKITYIMNSEALYTAWFFNEEAFKAAGITNADGSAKKPTTFNEMMEFCETLYKNGYTNPLGIAGDNDSITYSQFCWLLRVYGDQYFRDMLQKIQPVDGDYCYNELLNPFKLNLDDPQPEAASNYVVNVAREYWTILDESSADFVGPKSKKYGEFMSNLLKMKKYLPTTFNTKSLDDVRSDFVANRNDKSSPVILLDYLGFGLGFNNMMKDAGDRKFTLGIFDYPYMEGTEVHTNFVRDVGGNGGYLSIMDHGKDQNEVTLDFIKFFMSPYGQSAYYEGLESGNATPMGISTVKQLKLSEDWEKIFNSDDVKFNGLCDMNPYTHAMLWTVEGRATVTSNHAQLIRNLFQSKDVSKYQNDWQTMIANEYATYFSQVGYKPDCYKYPARNPV